MARTSTAATVGYYAAAITLGLGTAVVGPSLDALARRTESSIGDIGIVFTTTSIGYLFGALQSGRWFDRLPGHRVLGFALAVLGAAFAIIPASASLVVLAALFAIIGAATAAIDVGTNTLLLWSYRTHVARAMNGLHFCFGVGALIAPTIVAVSLSTTNDVTMAFVALAAITLLVALSFARLPIAPSAAQATESPGARETPAQRRLTALIAAVFAFYVAAEVTYGGWISTYAFELGFGDAAETAFLASLFWGLLTVGRLFAIPLTGRVRASTVIAIGFAGALACVVAIALLPRSPAVLWIATGAFGLCLAPIFPMTLVYSNERLPASGRRTSLFIAASGIGSMTLPWFTGRAFVAYGPTSLLWLDAATVALGGAALAFALRTGRNTVSST
ncbi:MAG TPA: MFS transporter [Pseudomonadales bacterium]|nr:MFS transporter [Pseudomonadales bacterium]